MADEAKKPLDNLSLRKQLQEWITEAKDMDLVLAKPEELAARGPNQWAYFLEKFERGRTLASRLEGIEGEVTLVASDLMAREADMDALYKTQVNTIKRGHERRDWRSLIEGYELREEQFMQRRDEVKFLVKELRNVSDYVRFKHSSINRAVSDLRSQWKVVEMQSGSLYPRSSEGIDIKDIT